MTCWMHMVLLYFVMCSNNVHEAKILLVTFRGLVLLQCLVVLLLEADGYWWILMDTDGSIGTKLTRTPKTFQNVRADRSWPSGFPWVSMGFQPFAFGRARSLARQTSKPFGSGTVQVTRSRGQRFQEVRTYKAKESMRLQTVCHHAGALRMYLSWQLFQKASPSLDIPFS